MAHPPRRRTGRAATAIVAADRTAEVPAIINPAPQRRRSYGARPRPDQLTQRQQEVAGLVASGLTNGQIAAELVLTAGTVANHVRAIFLRTGFHSRAQVAAWLGVPGSVGIVDTPAATAVFDAAGSLVKVNAAMGEMLGRATSCLERMHLADLAAEGSAWVRGMQHGLAADRAWHGEARLRRPDAPPVSVELIAHALDTPAGTLNVVSAYDLSARRAVEQRQREFIVMLGHELRSPLAAIQGYAQLMQRRRDGDAGALAVILHHARRLERLTADLLDLSRQDVGLLRVHREDVDLGELAAAVAEDARIISPEHPVRLLTPREPVVGRWDRLRLEQVLDNLVSNAIRYSPGGGTVTVRVARRGAEAEVAVDDEGIGIPSEALPYLFERFYRVQRPGNPVVEGLGLGLAISRAIVEAHGGVVAASSVPGHGSTFRVLLPCSPSGAAPGSDD